MTKRKKSKKIVPLERAAFKIRNCLNTFKPLLIGLTGSGLEFTPLFCSLFMARTLSQNTVERNWRKICADILRRQD